MNYLKIQKIFILLKIVGFPYFKKTAPERAPFPAFKKIFYFRAVPSRKAFPTTSPSAR